MDCTREYMAMNLKEDMVDASAALPSRTRVTMLLMLGEEEVKGAAAEASAGERESPTCAAFRAPQSLAPSPQKPTMSLSSSRRNSINFCFCCGDIRANTTARERSTRAVRESRSSWRR